MNEDRLRRLADREAIRDLASRYAHCVWSKDVAGVVALFSEDGVMDTGDGRPIRGSRALVAAYEQAFRESEFHPFVHNHLIDLHGDEASGVCYLDVRGTVNGESMIGAGRYDDRYVRVDGEWKFSSRKLTMSFFVPLSQGWARREEG